MELWASKVENMEINHSFWQGKKVLITGHTGFKGCWLTIWLHKMGAEVIGYSLEKYPNDVLFNDCKISGKIVDKRGDICDFDNLKKTFETYNPEIVFHLAAQPLVRESYKYPIKTLNTNIIGTANILECIKNSPSVKAGIIITSDKCYENKEQEKGYNENDRLGGNDPYSCSKACAELIVKAYRNSFFRKMGKFVATVRAGNVIGGGDWSKDRLIPDCVAALRENKPAGIRNPVSTRPWQHVLEPLSGYILLAQKLFNKEDVDQAWNFGPKPESILKVEYIANLFVEQWGSGRWEDLSKDQKDAPHEAKLLSLDISKSTSELKWKPKLDINEVIKFTVDWYKNSEAGYSYDLCIKQIDEYEKK